LEKGMLEMLIDLEDRAWMGAGPQQASSLGEIYSSVRAVRYRLAKNVEPRHIAAALKRVEREGKPITLAALLERIEEAAKG
jgi:hypothetical protein